MGRVPPPAKYLLKIAKKRKKQEKEGKSGNLEKEDKLGRKGKNREGSFTLPLLTEKTDYTTGLNNLNFKAIFFY